MPLRSKSTARTTFSSLFSLTALNLMVSSAILSTDWRRLNTTGVNEQVSALGNSLSHIPLQVLLFHIRFNKFKYLDNICIDVCKHYKPCTCLWHLDYMCVYVYIWYVYIVCFRNRKEVCWWRIFVIDLKHIPCSYFSTVAIATLWDSSSITFFYR